MKKILVFALLLLIAVMPVGAMCGCFAKKDTVVIYTNIEDFRIEKVEECLKKDLPNINVVIEYYDTGTLAAKVAAEGKDTLGDIIWGIDEATINRMLNNFAVLDGYDTSIYLDELVIPSKKYHIWSKEAGCVIVNKKVLREHGIDMPTSLSFADLLDSKYRGLLMMPNPKTSGTGYFYYNTYVANYGKAAAVSYFANLEPNIKEFSTSGSGPVKMADKGEIAIGLGMTFQAVDYVNKNSDLEIMFLEEGSPYSLYTSAIIDGRQNKKNVKKVYEYLYSKYFALDKEIFNPEIIYKGQTINKPGYPTNINYATMIRMNDASYKQELLDAWPID